MNTENNHKDINPLGTQVDYELENKAKSFSASHKYNASLWNCLNDCPKYGGVL